MLDKTYLLGAFSHQTRVITHLATKIRTDRLDYRPTPKQRSTIELLRYLAITGIGPVRYFLDGTWSFWETREAELGAIGLDGIPAEYARQEREFAAVLAGISTSELSSREVPDYRTNGKTVLDVAIADTALNYLRSYGMQLFLYAKSCGAEIGSSDLWAGRAAAASPGA